MFIFIIIIPCVPILKITSKNVASFFIFLPLLTNLCSFVKKFSFQEKVFRKSVLELLTNLQCLSFFTPLFTKSYVFLLQNYSLFILIVRILSLIATSYQLMFFCYKLETFRQPETRIRFENSEPVSIKFEPQHLKLF